MAMPMYYGYRPQPPPAQVSPTHAPGAAPWIINECRMEGENSFVVAYQLEGLCQAIPLAYQAHLVTTAQEARKMGAQLRDLADASYRHFQRVDLMVNFLNVALESIKKTLEDVKKYTADSTKSREMRWRTMYHNMTTEAGNVPLPQRFVLYSTYLSGLLQLLVRDVHFDDNRFQSNRDHILTLRGQQKLPPPTELVPFHRATQQLQLSSGAEGTHWAEEIFSRPLPSRTPLKHIRSSEAFGPFNPPGQVPVPPPASRILFERHFDDGVVTVTVYEDRVQESPYVLITKRQMGGVFYAELGAHELGIQRNRSALELRRWSRRENRPVFWAVLFFLTWEELELFYWSFVSLKIKSPSTTRPNPAEFTMAGEKRLFQAKIIDDHYNHSLIVYKDRYTKGWRLHAAVWDGELRQAPMWTAFISKIRLEPNFLKRRSTRRVWLHDLDIYAFSGDYYPEHQRHGRGSAFEIKFDSEPGAQHFVELFQPSSTEPSEATASTADSDEHSADDDGHNVRSQVKTLSASTSTSASNVTSATTSEDGSSNAAESREQSDDDGDEDDDDDRIIHSEDASESGAGDSDSHDDAYSEAHSESRQTDSLRSEDARSDDLHSDEPPRHTHPGRLADYVDYIGPDEISVEEIDSHEEDSDESSLGGRSDEATLKIGRRESILEDPEEEFHHHLHDSDGFHQLEGPDEIHQLGAPEELSRLEGPKEPAKITDGRPPKPSVEDCSDDEY